MLNIVIEDLPDNQKVRELNAHEIAYELDYFADTYQTHELNYQALIAGVYNRIFLEELEFMRRSGKEFHR